MGHRFVGSFAAASVFLLAALPHPRPPANFSEEVMTSGLTSPTAIAFLPDGRLLVTEKGGALKLVQNGTATTLTTLPVCTGCEMGLLGIAPHPDFETNGLVFLYRTKPPDAGCATSTGRFNQVVTVQMSGDTVVPGSLTERLSGIRTDGGNHDAGTLRIGPDQKLYVSVGDTGIGDGGPPGASTNPYSQDRGALEGKVLRLELDGLTPAAGNPFIGVAGARPEVFAFGFRNPFRMGFDPQTGRLWAGDVGQATIEEIDVMQSGGNYAWPNCEGTLPAGCQAIATPGPVIDPVFEYTHSGAGGLGNSVTGGAFATRSFGQLGGHYFFGDFTASKLFVSAPTAARDDIGTPAEFVTDAAVRWTSSSAPTRRFTGWRSTSGRCAGSCRATRDRRRDADAGLTRAGLPAVRLSGPDARPAARVRLLQPAGGALRPAHDRHPRRERPGCGLDRVRALRRSGRRPRHPRRRGRRGAAPGDHRRAPALRPGRLHGRAARELPDADHRQGQSTPRGGRVRRHRGGQPDRFTVPCTATPDPSIGATCSITTTVEAVTPGAVKEGMRANWQLGQIEVFDGGPDGDADTTPNTLFAKQGIFVP